MQDFERVHPLSTEKVQMFTRATAALRTQAAKHADFGVFKLKEQPADHYQDFRDVYFPPTDQPDLETIETFCNLIMKQTPEGKPRFDILREAFRHNQEATSHAREAMQAGKKILLVTPHRELADIAMAMAAAQVEIGETSLIRKTRVFVGPILKELQIQGVDAIDALRFSAGVIVGVPDTLSTQHLIESGAMDPEVKSIANTAVKEIFEQQKIDDEFSLVVTAPSGSTDAETENHILMKAVSRGTEIMAQRYFDFIWPTAVVMTNERTACEVGDLVQVSKGQTLHDIMRETMAPMYERVSGKTVNYQEPEPKRPRSLGSTALTD